MSPSTSERPSSPGAAHTPDRRSPMGMPSADSDAPPNRTFTAFSGFRRIARGLLPDVAAAARPAVDVAADFEGAQAILVFDDTSGRPVDLDLRGSEDEVRARAGARAAALERAIASGRTPDGPGTGSKRGRGRPRLGVVGKEVTLLPRHWAWLDAQPGGASATLRRLVEHARREGESQADVRRARDVTYRFMAAVCGDLPGYEEALRALFRGDAGPFDRVVAEWPGDVGSHARFLAAAAFDEADSERRTSGEGE